MQDTPASTPVTTAISFALLHAQFAALPDPRRAQGRRFPLAALLTLAVAAILANHLSVLAIAEWGAAQSAHVRRALGFTGDYLVSVKQNQQALYRDIAILFAHRADAALNAASLPAQDLREAATEDHGHGREERRTLTASRDLNDYRDWPGVGQVFMVERVWRERGREKGAVQYGVTSLPMARGGATRLLACKRGHWRIENGLHHVKDVTLGEDASRVRVGQGPNVLALLRDTALNPLRSTGCRTIAARLRHHCRCPDDLLILLDLPLTQHA